MFVDKLPTQVRVILAALPELSLDELAKKAESIMQVAHSNLGQAGLAAEKRSQPEEINNHLTQILINQHLEEKLSRLTETENNLQDRGTIGLSISQQSSSPAQPPSTWQQPPQSRELYNQGTFSAPRQQQSYRP